MRCLDLANIFLTIINPNVHIIVKKTTKIGKNNPTQDLNKNNEGSAIWLGFNAYKESMLFDLPTPISPWKKYIDTSILKTKNVSKKPLANQSNVLVESNSLVLMVASEYSKKIKL